MCRLGFGPSLKEPIKALGSHSGSVSGVVSLGSVGPPPSWFGVFSSSVLTSTIGSLDSSFLSPERKEQTGCINSGVRFEEASVRQRFIVAREHTVTSRKGSAAAWNKRAQRFRHTQTACSAVSHAVSFTQANIWSSSASTNLRALIAGFFFFSSPPPWGLHRSLIVLGFKSVCWQGTTCLRSEGAKHLCRSRRRDLVRSVARALKKCFVKALVEIFICCVHCLHEEMLPNILRWILDQRTALFSGRLH